MRTDITQTYHRHKRKGGTKSKRRRGRASERERARERKVDRKTDRQTDRERKETQPDRQGQNSVCASRSPSEKHTRLCVVWEGDIHGAVDIFGASEGLVSRYISRLPHSNLSNGTKAGAKSSREDDVRCSASGAPINDSLKEKHVSCPEPVGISGARQVCGASGCRSMW